MTQTRIAKCLFLTALAAFICFPVFGEIDGPGQQGPRFEARIISQFLELTEEQIAATENLREEYRVAAEPIIAQQRELRQLMKELLEADPQDPTAIGQAVIDIQTGREALKAEWDGFIAAFEGLLTETQAEDWEDYQTLRRLSHRGPRPGESQNHRRRRPNPPEQP